MSSVFNNKMAQKLPWGVSRKWKLFLSITWDEKQRTQLHNREQKPKIIILCSKNMKTVIWWEKEFYKNVFWNNISKYLWKFVKNIWLLTKVTLSRRVCKTVLLLLSFGNQVSYATVRVKLIICLTRLKICFFEKLSCNFIWLHKYIEWIFHRTHSKSLFVSCLNGYFYCVYSTNFIEPYWTLLRFSSQISWVLWEDLRRMNIKEFALYARSLLKSSYSLCFFFRITMMRLKVL